MESSRVREPRRIALGFYGDGISFRVVFSQIILAQSPSWRCTPGSAKMDAREKDSGRWSDTWCLLNLSPTLPVAGGLLVPCFLPGPPVVKQLMQMVTTVPGQGGRFQSVCFP